MGNLLQRISKYLLYRTNPTWRFNLTSEDEEEKFRRWYGLISNEDKESIDKITSRLTELISENPGYQVSLIAHGSTTYGKKLYHDIDLILEPTNGRIEMYEQLFSKLRKDFDVFLNGGYYFDRDWILHFHQANLAPKHDNARPIQIGYRTIIFDEEYANPMDGKDLTQLFRRLGKPYVPLILDNQQVRK